MTPPESNLRLPQSPPSSPPPSRSARALHFSTDHRQSPRRCTFQLAFRPRKGDLKEAEISQVDIQVAIAVVIPRARRRSRHLGTAQASSEVLEITPVHVAVAVVIEDLGVRSGRTEQAGEQQQGILRERTLLIPDLQRIFYPNGLVDSIQFPGAAKSLA